MKLLVVEDERKMSRLLHRGLTEEGHVVDVCERGLDALDQARTVDYDVIVLDWMLPDVDGLTVLRRLRELGRRTPVLMLTARGSVGERVAGLRGGADDYLAKPFDFEELLARLEALSRRGTGAEVTRALGDVTLDVHRRALVRGTESATLSGREFQVFGHLAQHVGDVVSRTELLAHVWGSNFDGDANVVDVYVGYLRNHLKSIGAEQLALRTVRGVGYRLEVLLR